MIIFCFPSILFKLIVLIFNLGMFRDYFLREENSGIQREIKMFFMFSSLVNLFLL